MDEGCIVRVIKDFLTINEGELCVTKGEFLQVRKKFNIFIWVKFFFGDLVYFFET